MSARHNRRVTLNTPGHAHQLNFSCYRRLPLLKFDPLRLDFLESLDAVRAKHQLEVWAYVIMPEHVHVLANPRLPEYSIEAVRKDLKGGFAQRALRWLERHEPTLHAKLVLQGGGRRFWQDGKGYDRNLWSPPATWQSIEYIHGNPVARGLCETPLDWPWSSARWFEDLRPVPFEPDPCPVEPPWSSKGVWRSWWEPQ